MHTNKLSDCSVVRLEMLEYHQRVLTYLELYTNQDTKTSKSCDACTMIQIVNRMIWQRGLHNMNEMVLWNSQHKQIRGHLVLEALLPLRLRLNVR